MCRGIRIEACGKGDVAFGTTLRVTQSTGNKNKKGAEAPFPSRSKLGLLFDKVCYMGLTLEM